MDRVEINDMVMGAYFTAMKQQGLNTKPLEDIYAKQRAVIEAEEVARKEDK